MYKTLDMLVRDAKSKGITAISSEATERYGFIQRNDKIKLSEL